MDGDARMEGETPGDGRADADALAFQVLNEANIIAQLSTARLARALPDGLAPNHFAVLNHFARLGGERSPAQLAKAFQVTRGTMTSTLQKLEALGFVAIRGDATDGRRKIVTATPAGLAARERAIAAVGPALAAFVEGVGTDRLARLAPELAAVRAWLDENR